MKTIGQQVADYMEWRGWKARQMAEHIQKHPGGETVKRQHIENLLKDGVGQPKYLHALAVSMGVTADDLLEGRYRKPTPQDAQQFEVRVSTPILLRNNPDYPSIRRVRFKLSAGCSGFSVEYPEDSYAVPFVFPREWYEKRNYNPSSLFAVGVSNGSMEPGLHDGDTVVVNTADVALKDGEVYAVNYEGELVIKRMVRDAGQWWLASDNPDQRRYPRKICDEHVFCVGRIVHKQSETI